MYIRGRVLNNPVARYYYYYYNNTSTLRDRRFLRRLYYIIILFAIESRPPRKKGFATDPSAELQKGLRG